MSERTVELDTTKPLSKSVTIGSIICLLSQYLELIKDSETNHRIRAN